MRWSKPFFLVLIILFSLFLFGFKASEGNSNYWIKKQEKFIFYDEDQTAHIRVRQSTFWENTAEKALLNSTSPR